VPFTVYITNVSTPSLFGGIVIDGSRSHSIEPIVVVPPIVSCLFPSFLMVIVIVIRLFDLINVAFVDT